MPRAAKFFLAFFREIRILNPNLKQFQSNFRQGSVRGEGSSHILGFGSGADRFSKLGFGFGSGSESESRVQGSVRVRFEFEPNPYLAYLAVGCHVAYAYVLGRLGRVVVRCGEAVSGNDPFLYLSLCIGI